MPEVKSGFPLILWEQTEDYARQKAEAEARVNAAATALDKQGKRGTDREVQFTGNCIPVVWRNASYGSLSRPSSVADALKRAESIGATGYYTPEELEDFVEGRGFIVEIGMNDLGFRKHKKIPDRWAKDNKAFFPTRYKVWEMHNGIDVEEVEGDEAERLNDMAKPNEEVIYSRTYSVTSGRSGLIFIDKDTNPFSADLSQLARDLAQKAHINRQQEGFVINARNVSVPDSDGERRQLVHIQAVTDDDKVVEVAWPSRTYGQTIVYLAVDLKNKVDAARQLPAHTQSPLL
jgi:hypothetical protein